MAERQTAGHLCGARDGALLYHLGVQGGQLRSDMVHTWSDQGEWAPAHRFNLLQEPVAPRCLFLDEHPGMSHTRFLQWGEAWVRLSHAGADCAGTTAAMVSPDRMIVLPVALEGIPTQDPQRPLLRSLSLAEQGWAGDSLANWPMASCNASGAAWAGLCAHERRLIGLAHFEVSLRSAMRRGLSPPNWH